MYKNIEFEKPVGGKVHEILSLEIALTRECNFHCPYCGAYDADQGTALPVEAFMRMIDKTPSIKRIKLSGGEVTLRYDDCIRMAQFCKYKGIELQINTNGTLLTAVALNELKDKGLKTIHFSLNFDNAKDYSAYYGVDEMIFYNLLKTISAAADLFGNACIVETIICEDFMQNINGVNQLLYTMGVRGHELQYGMDQEKWVVVSAHIDFEHILLDLFSRKADDMTIYMSCFNLLPDGKAAELYKKYVESKTVVFANCIDGVYQFHIHENGDVIVCDIGFPYKVGYIDDQDSLRIDYVSDALIEHGIHHCGKRYTLG